MTVVGPCAHCGIPAWSKCGWCGKCCPKEHCADHPQLREIVVPASMGIPTVALPYLQAWADNLGAVIEINGIKADGTVIPIGVVEPSDDSLADDKAR